MREITSHHVLEAFNVAKLALPAIHTLIHRHLAIALYAVCSPKRYIQEDRHYAGGQEHPFLLAPCFMTLGRFVYRITCYPLFPFHFFPMAVPGKYTLFLLSFSMLELLLRPRTRLK